MKNPETVLTEDNSVYGRFALKYLSDIVNFARQKKAFLPCGSIYLPDEELEKKYFIDPHASKFVTLLSDDLVREQEWFNEYRDQFNDKQTRTYPMAGLDIAGWIKHQESTGKLLFRPTPYFFAQFLGEIGIEFHSKESDTVVKSSLVECQPFDLKKALAEVHDSAASRFEPLSVWEYPRSEKENPDLTKDP